MSQALIEELKRENLCTHFVIPFLKLNKLSFIASNFVDSYLSADGHFIVVQVMEQYLLSRKVLKHPYYTGMYRKAHEAKGFYLVYRVPPRWHNDVELFRKGQYSRMSDAAKSMVRTYSSLPNKIREGTRTVTDGRLLAFEKHPLLRQMWEAFIADPRRGEFIPEEMELLSVPGERSYIKLDDLYKIERATNG